MKLVQVALVVAGGLAIAGCQLDGAKTRVPAKRAAAADYQQALAPSPPPPNLRSICYNAADLTVMRARMFHQEMVVATLQCQTPSGGRAFDSIYGRYLGKFGGELSSNARSLHDLSRRKRFNIDTLVTEYSNRMAQRAPVDKEFCSRSLRALEWALDPKVTSLSQTPPPYDLGPEMKIHPCTAP